MSFFDRQGIPEKFIKNLSDDAAALKDFLESQGVPAEMTRGASVTTEVCGAIQSAPLESQNSEETKKRTEDDIWDEGFETDIRMLRDFSFISINRDPQIFEMHRLVQLAMRNWLTANGKEETWKIHFIWNVYRAFPAKGADTWGDYQSLFPHIKAAMSQRPALSPSRIIWILVLQRGASMLILLEIRQKCCV